MKRREAREKAFQFLFQIDINQEDPEQLKEEYVTEQGNDTFLKHLIEGVMKHKDEMDNLIEENLENWTLERLPSVELTALRLATFEMHYMDDIPTNVSINEAVELGKRFGDEKSGKFINGVLSNINRKKGNVE